MDLVIGAKGFIGANLIKEIKSYKNEVFGIDIDSNLNEYKNKIFENVYFCAGNSRTYISNKEPVKCLTQNVIDLYYYLSNFNYEKFVFLSSIIVYPADLEHLTEDSAIDISKLPMYGIHKYLAEQYVKKYAKNWLIIRPTSFFGEGLVKNLIFDIKNNATDIYFKKETYLDYMPISWFCDILITLSNNVDNDIVNVGSSIPLPLTDILKLKNLDYKFFDERFQDDRKISYEKMNKNIPNKLTSEYILKRIADFISN